MSSTETLMLQAYVPPQWVTPTPKSLKQFSNKLSRECETRFVAVIIQSSGNNGSDRLDRGTKTKQRSVIQNVLSVASPTL